MPVINHANTKLATVVTTLKLNVFAIDLDTVSTMLPGLVVIYYFAVSTDVFDKVNTVRFRVVIERYSQHLTVF